MNYAAKILLHTYCLCHLSCPVEDNLKAADVDLTADPVERLNQVSAIELGFPGDFFKEDGVKVNSFGGFYDKVEKRD